MTRFTVLASLATLAMGDIYLHNPRGSNNRLDDQNRDRNNANRLFDSQNNNRGGSNVGSMYFHKGSKLSIEWTAQHGCGNSNGQTCEVILQYMCDDRLRDGTTTNTIPQNPKDCYNYDCDTDVRFGRQESFDSYKACKYRSRNKGVFTSSQNLNGNSAIYTRQNPNGARRGLECPEERDYFPYWGPSEWKDIAVLVNNEEDCAYYNEYWANVVNKRHCQPRYQKLAPDGNYIDTGTTSPGDVSMGDYAAMHDDNANDLPLIPITREECEMYVALKVTTPMDKAEELLTFFWVESNEQTQNTPACKLNELSRDNHLGDTFEGKQASYMWEVPDNVHEQCALRIRYNISTLDYDRNVNSTMNKENGGNANKPSMVPIWETYDLEAELGMELDYQLRNNPKPDPFAAEADVIKGRMDLQMAINTAQYGRTFQDRSHKFAIRPAPADEEACAKVHNLNVRGKRGNIVQTYPGTEYDFVPNKLTVKKGDCVHIQWTGSNTNPNNNAGQGRQGSDRHNMVGLGQKSTGKDPLVGDGTGALGSSYPKKIDTNPASTANLFSLNGAEYEELLIQLGILDGHQFGGEMSELDDAGTYQDFGIVKINTDSTGVWNYLCTRNNNFSNRSQKAQIVISDQTSQSMVAGSQAFQFSAGDDTWVKVDAGVFTQPTVLTVTNTPVESSGGLKTSEVIQLAPTSLGLAGNKMITISMPYSGSFLQKAVLMEATSANGPWTEVPDFSVADGMVSGQVNHGGFFMTTNVANGVVVFALVAGLLSIAGVAGFCMYKKKQGGATGNVYVQNKI